MIQQNTADLIWEANLPNSKEESYGFNHITLIYVGSNINFA